MVRQREWLWRTSPVWVGCALLLLGCETPGAGALVPEATELAASVADADALSVGVHEVTGVEVALTQVQRASGDTLTVRWSYRNRTQEAKPVTGEIGETYLVDPVNRKKYLIVRDANDRPVGGQDGDPNRGGLPAGQTLTAWAKFAAPADDVEQISVYIPNVSPFEDIPISSGDQ